VRNFVARARAIELRRRGLRSLLDAALVVSSLIAIGLLTTDATKRGDGVAPLLAVGVIVTLTTTLVLWIRFGRRMHDTLSTAKEIALRGETGSLNGNRRLRQNILGACELLEALDPKTDQAQPVRHPGSPELARAFTDQVASEIIRTTTAPEVILHAPFLRSRLLAIVGVTIAFVALSHTIDDLRATARLLLNRVDGRPPSPPSPLWSSLALELTYPPHTARPKRTVHNPSGSLRVPAGTAVRLNIVAIDRHEAMQVVVAHDPETPSLGAPSNRMSEQSYLKTINLKTSATPKDSEYRWHGNFEVQGPGSWTVLAFSDGTDSRSQRASTMHFEIEVDGQAEVDLLAIAKDRREVSATDSVPLRFTARDDFGLLSASLVYTLGGEVHRVPIETPPAARRWRGRHTWDISSIPLESRSEVVYWIEVRDNDPGLGWSALDDPPGKVARSDRHRLFVNDDDAEHAANIEGLQELRDFAVDLLAFRLTTSAFASATTAEAQTGGLIQLRKLHGASESLLIGLSSMIDRLSIDTKVRKRELRILAAIHERLVPLHSSASTLHESFPEGADTDFPSKIPAFARRLKSHNTRAVRRLEDEIIRLDDLVDGQIIRSIEALVARLQTSQQKMIQLLEQLQAGDESVKPRIEQLQRRTREDMRRLAQARQRLRKEVGEEYLNMDAFRSMEARMRNQDLLQRLQRGEIDQALKQARESLDETRSLRDAIQKKTSEEQEAPRLSPEAMARMKLLRELSRIQDEQSSLRAIVGPLDTIWRNIADDPPVAHAKRIAKKAKVLRKDLDKVHDARLSRDARDALEDLRDDLESLESLADTASSSEGKTNALQAFEIGDDALQSLRRARQGATDHAEKDALRALDAPLRAIVRQLKTGLPQPSEVFDATHYAEFAKFNTQQSALEGRLAALHTSDDADPLPAPGHAALDHAERAMQAASNDLRSADVRSVQAHQQRAWQQLQKAIDSLRSGQSPPPRMASSDDISTAAEQDRSLREQVVDAMREGKNIDPVTERYYEELLR